MKRDSKESLFLLLLIVHLVFWYHYDQRYDTIKVNKIDFNVRLL